jgi:hypothetical protein
MLKRWSLAVFVISGFALVTLYSCENSKEPIIENCDNTPRTYNNDVKPIIDANCTVCHNPNGAFPSILLTTYAEVRNATENGELLPSIKHEPTAVPMPSGGNKLSALDIAKIECWVSKGYPE